MLIRIPTFHFNSDPDPAPHQSDVNMRPPVYWPSTTPFWASTPPLWAPRAPFQASKAPKFCHERGSGFSFSTSNADPDPANQNNADLDPYFGQKLLLFLTKHMIPNHALLRPKKDARFSGIHASVLKSCSLSPCFPKAHACTLTETWCVILRICETLSL